MTALTAAKVKAFTKSGMHHDGRGLYLRVAPGGSKGWMLRATIDGRRRDIGLGGYPAVSLAKARQFADAHRLAVAEGRRSFGRKAPAKMPTFAEAAAKVHEVNLPRWKNGKHTDQWINTLRSYAFPVIGNLRLDRITRRDVLAVLTPIWTTKPETARRFVSVSAPYSSGRWRMSLSSTTRQAKLSMARYRQCGALGHIFALCPTPRYRPRSIQSTPRRRAWPRNYACAS